MWVYYKKPVDYIESLNTMEDLVNSIISGSINENIVLSLEHNDVYTAGSSAKESDLLIERDKEKGKKKDENKDGAIAAFQNFDIPVVNVSRGGQFTYHGPGQLVCYFILNLADMSLDIKKYINLLQRLIINTLYELNINAFTIDGEIGVFVDKNFISKHECKNKEDKKNEERHEVKSIKKIASIGVKVRRYIAYHGIALNCNTDLRKFLGIRPCGMNGDLQTSIQDLGISVSVSQINDILRKEFYKLFI